MAGFRMTTNIPTLQEIEKVVTADVAAVEEAAMDEKERYLIDLSKEYTEPNFLIKSNGAGVLARGDIAAIKAKSKSGKSFVCSIFASVVLGTPWGDLQPTLKGGKVLYFDTEQNKLNTAKLAKRVHALCNFDIHSNSDKFKCYALRQMDMDNRLPFIKKRIEEEKPTLAVIDGIVDLIQDFNDIKQSSDVIQALMQISADNDCSVLFVLHENKSDENMRGHLGSMSAQKCADVFQIEKRKDGTLNVTECECRNLPIPDFSFAIDSYGIPRPTQTQKQLQADEKSAMKEAKFRQVFAEIFSAKGTSIIRYSDLVSMAKLHFAVEDRMAKENIKWAKENGILVVNNDGYSLDKCNGAM